MARTHGKNAFLFVIVTVALDLLAFGIFIPVVPDFLTEITGKSESETVAISGFLTATFGVVNFLMMPTLGNLSDRFGRRPVLLTSIAVLCIDFLIMGFAHSLFVLFIGRALAGLASATYSTASAYIADVTEPENRSRAFGMIGAAFGFGFVFGPVIGGLLGDIHTRLPFFVSAGIAACNFLYGLFVLPESLDKEHRRPFDIKRSNPLGAFTHFAKLPKIAWFLVAVSIFGLAHAVYPGSWNFYGAIRYGWDSQHIGLSLGFVGISSAIVQALLVGPITKKIGPEKAAYVGFSFSVFGMFAMAFAFEGWMAYTVIVMSALSGIANPSLQTMMTSVTPRNAQGELQGAMASLQSLSMIIGPVMMTQILHYFTQPEAPIYFAGANFLLAGTLAAIAMIPLIIGIRSNHDEIQHVVAKATDTPEPT